MTKSTKPLPFETRRATPADADRIAAAHVDSIRSLGARAYSADVIDDWAGREAAHHAGDAYVRAMERDETFYVAVGSLDGVPAILGFASHLVADDQHRTAVYVRGSASRRGVGSALFRLAETQALAAGARSLHVDASLAAVDFYKANGFDEISRGQHRLRSGRLMSCVVMRKDLAAGANAGAFDSAPLADHR